MSDENRWEGMFFGVYPSEGFPSDCVALFANVSDAQAYIASQEWGCEMIFVETKLKAEIREA